MMGTDPCGDYNNTTEDGHTPFPWEICGDCGHARGEHHGDYLPPLPHIDIVFDGPPGPTAGRFVEVENENGASIRVGEWILRAAGYWVLRIPKGELSG